MKAGFVGFGEVNTPVSYTHLVDSDKNASPGIFIYPMNRRQRTQNIGEKAGRRMLALLQRGFIHRKVTRDEIDCLKRKTRSKLLRSFQLDSDGEMCIRDRSPLSQKGCM